MSKSENVLKQIDQKIKEAGADGDDLEFDDLNIPKITDEIKEKLQKVKELAMLSLNNCGLESLNNFPKLPNLVRLELNKNKFPVSELTKLVDKMPKLQILLLGENEIKEFDEISCLSGLKKLMNLELANTPLSQKENYREKVYEMLPSLEVLDDLDRNGNPYEFDEDEGGLGGNHDDEDEEDEEDEEEYQHDDEEEEEEEDDEEEDEEEEEDFRKRNTRKRTKK